MSTPTVAMSTHRNANYLSVAVRGGGCQAVTGVKNITETDNEATENVSKLAMIHAMLAAGILDMDLSRIAGRALGIVIGATIVILVIAEVLPDLFNATADINAELGNASLNSTAAENIAGVMPLIVGVLVVFLVVGLVAGFVSRQRNKGV